MASLISVNESGSRRKLTLDSTAIGHYRSVMGDCSEHHNAKTSRSAALPKKIAPTEQARESQLPSLGAALER